MLETFDAGRFRRGLFLTIAGIGFVVVGYSIGTEFATSTRLMIWGPLVVLGGIGYIGASAIPVVVHAVGGADTTWDDLSLPWQMAISFLVVVFLLVGYSILALLWQYIAPVLQ